MLLSAENTRRPQPRAPVSPTRIDALNARFRHHSATEVLRFALTELGNIALVSSFGAQSVTLLHMAAVIDRDVPVLFIDTELLFTETLIYQGDVAERLGLRNLRILRADDITRHDPEGTLHQRDPDRCCALRKTRPLAAALAGFDGWISGRKRFQSQNRASLDFFEVEPGNGRLKINPLAHWSAHDLKDYAAENNLPRHPLVAQGYPSIGCAPCTTTVAPGEDPRAGRWRARPKTECGIHFVNGKMLRTGDIT